MSRPLLVGALLLAAVSAIWPNAAASAGDAASPERIEVWTGAEAFEHAWSLYTGGTVAPFGSVREDGLRFRATGGYGRYTYTSGPAAAPLTHHGSVAFADVLVGYHVQLGPVTWKAFAGAAFADTALTPGDPATAIAGAGLGGKAVSETWWTIDERSWAALDLSWSSLHSAHAARARLGWRLWPALSAGVESGAAGNRESGSARLGAFLRYEWETGEVSATGGVASDALLQGLTRAHSLDAGTPFATVTWLTRF